MTKTPWIGVFALLFLQSCSQPDRPAKIQQSVAKAVPYFNELQKLDNPDYATQLPSSIQTSKVKTGVISRFSNADHSRLLSTEVNYFNGQIDSVGIYQYSADQLTRMTWYNGPGPDGIWQTADDLISGYHDHAPTATDVIYTIYRNPGADQTWFTEDDDILYYDKPVLDSAGNVIGTGTFTLPGDDGIWFTADDFIGWLTTENITNNEKRWVMYLSAGSDNNWLTLEDNEVFRFARITLNANGERERHTYYDNPGADGLVFTGDDEINYYHDYGYDDLGRIKQAIMYGGAGVDAIWYTADDAINTCKILNRDANDLPIRTVSYRPGPDNSCFTADDAIWGYHADSYDAANLLTETSSYYLPGEDTSWFTPDDVIIYTRTYQ